MIIVLFSLPSARFLAPFINGNLALAIDSASLKAKIKTNTKTKETWIFSSHSKRPPQPQQSHCLLSQLASLDLTLTLCFINTYSRRKEMLQMRRHITSWLIGLFANTSPVWITIMVNFNISIESLFSVISNLPNWMLIKKIVFAFTSGHHTLCRISANRSQFALHCEFVPILARIAKFFVAQSPQGASMSSLAARAALYLPS